MSFWYPLRSQTHSDTDEDYYEYEQDACRVRRASSTLYHGVPNSPLDVKRRVIGIIQFWRRKSNPKLPTIPCKVHAGVRDDIFREKIDVGRHILARQRVKKSIHIKIIRTTLFLYVQM